MPLIFQTYKTIIDQYLLDFLESKEIAFAQVNNFGPDLLERVKKLAVAGKTIRGSLVLLSYCFTHEKLSENSLKLAVAMELFQSALIVHDDIMDKDTKRRGALAMHLQYKSEAMAICVGDVLFFLAFELLGQIQTDKVTMGRIVRLIGREYQSVSIAQMGDVAKTAKTKTDIFNLYTNKTARYTFALPLMLGVTLAGTTKQMLKFLESYGVAVGLLFQTRDDELDREKNPFSQKDIDGFKIAAKESLTRLPLEEKHKLVLHELMDFVLKRTK